MDPRFLYIFKSILIKLYFPLQGIYFLQKAGKSHLLLSGNEGKELNLIIMDGTFTMADLSNLSNMSSDDSE